MGKRKYINRVEGIYRWFEEQTLLRCIRDGLVRIIPIVFLGAFSLVLKNIPIVGYQNFIGTFWDGAISKLFLIFFNATLGIIAIYLTYSISICFAHIYMQGEESKYGTAFSSMIAFFVFSGAWKESVGLSAVGVLGVFSAIICSVSASLLYFFFSTKVFKKIRFFSDGADYEFNHALNLILPIFATSLCFIFCHVVIFHAFGFNSFQEILIQLMTDLFSGMNRSLGSVLLFEFLVGFLWFFGIHGNNVFEYVAQEIFVPAISINQELVESGQAATEIFSKTFLDVFALMGGTGNALSLFFAIVIFGKNKSDKKLASFSLLPMLVNINESMLFGLPVVLNPLLFIPFIITPIILVLISTFAIQVGFVPIPFNTVEWTTPAIISGYLATESIAGSILQIFNIFVGTMIYCPFIKLNDKLKMNMAHKNMKELLDILHKSESDEKYVELTKIQNSAGKVARSIAMDLKYRLKEENPRIFYQPQFNENGQCIGAEALLRWKHSLYGDITPPLIVKIAEEIDLLFKLETSVFNTVMENMDDLIEKLGKDVHISVNVTGDTIKTHEFEQFLVELKERYPEKISYICIEITEQSTFVLEEYLIERLTRIHNMGYFLAIDDFSMGSTSIKYLEVNVFDFLKLDGELSRNVISNARSCDIVKSIVQLANNLGIQTLAEYVETEEQRKLLESIGCDLYQGYLYSPAVPIERLKSK